MGWSDPQEACIDSQQGLQDVTCWGLSVFHLRPFLWMLGGIMLPTSLRAFAHAWNSLPQVVSFRVYIRCPRVFIHEDEV